MNCPAASLTPSTLPDALEEVAYSQTLSISGTLPGTVSWSVTSGSLPAGLSIDPSTGEIAGMPTATGSSSFTIEASNGTCTASEDYTIDVNAATSVHDIVNTSGIKVYPNPFSQVLQVEFMNPLQTEYDVYMIDHSGTETLVVDLVKSNSSGRMKIDLSGLKTGVYMLKIKSENNTFIKKVVKE